MVAGLSVWMLKLQLLVCGIVFVNVSFLLNSLGACISVSFLSFGGTHLRVPLISSCSCSEKCRT